MKHNLFIGILFFLSVFMFSCNISQKENENIKGKIDAKSKVENFKKIEIEIEGMTCEIGCAKLIESKLSKTEGVKYAKVSFEEKLGRIEYDANIINQKQFYNLVQSIAGGDLYKIVRIENVNKFTAYEKK